MAIKEWKMTKWVKNMFKRPVNEASTKSKKNNIIKKIGLAFIGQSSGRDSFQGPEGFDFETIEKAYLTDSYIRMAVDKYIDFMFKAGWDITGKNPKVVQYIKQRMSAAAHASEVPTELLFQSIAEELIKYHNVFIIKARQPNSYSYPQGLKVSPVGNNTKPVAGYFVLPTNTVEISRDKHGTIKKYQQEIDGGEKPLTIKTSDMIHMYVDKPPGRAFGFPFIWEVLDDVKMLRQLEELVDRMIYKNIFPLYVYQVGLDKEGFQATDDEIDEVREKLGELTLDGGMVLPERHNIKVIGADGKALDVEGYLKYFEKRVFTGLGVSEMLMGRGDTANRSTSDNMDAAFKDRIKSYQKVMTMFVNSFMINELLLEGGFDPLLNEDHKVEFRFREIDFDSKIKEENHAIQKFTQNAITHDELRLSLGMDPVTDEDRLYFNMITANLKQLEAANNAGDNKDRPENQHGKKDSPGKKEFVRESSKENDIDKLSDFLSNRWELIKLDTLQQVREFYKNFNNKDKEFDVESIRMFTELASRSMSQVIKKHLTNQFIQGANSARMQSEKSSKSQKINYTLSIQNLADNTDQYLNRLLKEDLLKRLNKIISESNKENVVLNIASTFDVLKYRLKFLSTTELNRAYNYGFSKVARTLGHKKAYVNVAEECEICLKYKDALVDLYNEEIPPFHSNCKCKLTLIKKGGNI